MIGVRIQGLAKTLGPNRALDGVSLELEPGLLHGLIGPDGAGKTTLLRTLVGLLKPTAGSVEYSREGRPIPFAELRPALAYMPQRPSLYPDLSCDEHLRFFADLYRLPAEVFKERSEELLRLARLDKFRDRRAGALSGGMYKKLGLMCALLQSPEAIFLDEPTNGVDPISRREFWELLYGLAHRRILIVVSTAYMDEAERCARVHLLEEGKVLATGEPAAILEREKVSGFEELFLRHAGEGR